MLRTRACGFYTQVCCIPSGSQELGSAERKVSVNATNVKLFLQILGGALCTHHGGLGCLSQLPSYMSLGRGRGWGKPLE